MSRLSQGWRLTKQSLAVVRDEPALIGLTVAGTVVVGLVALGIPAGVLWERDVSVPAVILGAIGAYGVALFGILFAVAVAACAARASTGRTRPLGTASRRPAGVWARSRCGRSCP